SKAKPCVMPSRCWILTAVAGKVLSGVEVATMMQSRSAGAMPASASAARAAASPREAVVSSSAAMKRWRMPVRCTIQASLVSTTPSSSRLLTALRGKAEPTPLTTDLIILANLFAGIRLQNLAFPDGGRADQLDIGANLVEQVIADHVIPKLDRRGVALIARAAMALHDNAIQAEEYPAIGLTHVQL